MKVYGSTPPGRKPIAEWTQEEIDYEFARSLMIVDRLSKGLPIRGLDPVVLDRVAEAFRAAEPSVQARERHRRAG